MSRERRVVRGRVAIRLWAALVLGLVASASAAAREPTVVMVSLDGTRPADVAQLPALQALAAQGLRAQRLIPTFPTNTFPNHVTLVTGVAPDRHGIVDNDFVDPKRGPFDRSHVASFIEVEPIWSWLARHGVISAAYHWVGSDGPWPGSPGEPGAGPRYAVPFDPKTPEKAKVEQILAWLDLPEGERPQLVTSWFHGADHAAHVFGPGAPEVAEALVSQQAALAQLISGIEARGLWPSLTLLVVSDHGMVAAEERVDLTSALERAGIAGRVFGIGGFASVRLDAPARDRERAVAVARGLGLSAWSRADAPAALRVDNERFGDVVVLARIGRAIVHPGLELRGFHGYRRDAPEMSAILFARGRRVPRGATLATVDNVDVAPTILSLLDVPAPAWMEGRALPLLAAPPTSGTIAPPNR